MDGHNKINSTPNAQGSTVDALPSQVVLKDIHAQKKALRARGCHVDTATPNP